MHFKIRNGEVSVARSETKRFRCALYSVYAKSSERQRYTQYADYARGKREKGEKQRIEEAHTHNTVLTNCQHRLINKFLYLSVISGLFSLIVSQCS